MTPALDAILRGEYDIDSRVMLHAEHWRAHELLASGRVLIDVVINMSALARIIEIEVSLNDLYVNSFRADGLIVSPISYCCSTTRGTDSPYCANTYCTSPLQSKPPGSAPPSR